MENYFLEDSATLTPNNLAVSRSPSLGASSGLASEGEMASAPLKPPVQLVSL